MLLFSLNCILLFATITMNQKHICLMFRHGRSKHPHSPAGNVLVCLNSCSCDFNCPSFFTSTALSPHSLEISAGGRVLPERRENRASAAVREREGPLSTQEPEEKSSNIYIYMFVYCYNIYIYMNNTFIQQRWITFFTLLKIFLFHINAVLLNFIFIIESKPKQPSEGSCDTEDWRLMTAENSDLPSQE